MSKALMREVWDCDLPHGEKCVLAAMAYNGDDAGNNIWPSIETVARRAAYSERMTRYIIAKLKKKQILVVVERKGRQHGYVVNYSLDLSGVPRLDTLQPLHPSGVSTEDVKDDVTGVTHRVQPAPDRVQSVPHRVQSATSKGAIAIAEEQYKNSKEEERKEAPPLPPQGGRCPPHLKEEKAKPAKIAPLLAAIPAKAIRKPLSNEEVEARRAKLKQQDEENRRKYGVNTYSPVELIGRRGGSTIQ